MTNMHSTEPKPCPFCGKQPFIAWIDVNTSSIIYRFSCSRHHTDVVIPVEEDDIQGKGVSRKSRAIQFWNERAYNE